MVDMFDDLFLSEIIRNLFLLPVLISIAVGIFNRNIFFIIIGALIVAFSYEIYADGGRIIVQSLVAAGIAHILGALGGFIVAKIVR